MNKFAKASLIALLCIFIVFVALISAYFAITHGVTLDKNKLLNPDRNVIIYDGDGNEIVSASVSGKRKSVKLEDLSDDCINAFIASEDRTFFSHRGLNGKRMMKALYTNVVSRSFKEGASTISQQLIKNTHLSQDKTISRKLKEIRLTIQLERAYSKNEILEMYLNTIYFGHNCYGLQSAAEFYFDKRAENLSLTESATLVGLLSSPNNYSPFKNPEKSLKKRNTVLKSMHDEGYISAEEYQTALNTPLNAKKALNSGKNADYINAVFDEYEEISEAVYGLPSGCVIKTYLNSGLQALIESIDYGADNRVIVTDKNGGVNAYKTTIGEAKRQPGSTIKPLLVYGPAIEERLLNPLTRITDEKINYNGYSPENFDKKYHGAVTVTDSIKYSYNVPAVKTLNSLTVDVAEKYASRMNIALDGDEKNLSLALGGMKYGLSLKEITDCYGIFQSGGIYMPSRFIKEIVTPQGVTVYKNEFSQSRVFSEGTCSLMNGMLIETSKDGTAKKLRNLPYNVASKTGTCGTEEGNTDAYDISYTSEHRIGVWLGDGDNKKTDVTGGGDCCTVAERILQSLYQSASPAPLDVTTGTSSVEIDADEYYDNGKLILADDLSPKLNRLTVRLLQGTEPKQKSTRFSLPEISQPSIKVKNNAVNIELCQTKYYAYLIKRYKNDSFEVIYDGNWKKTVADSPNEGYYVYTVTPYFVSGENKIYGKEISLPPVSVNKNGGSPQVKIPDIANEDWYNL